MKFLISVVIVCLTYSIKNIIAQLQPISEIQIIFNATGINYPEDVRFFLYTRQNPTNPQFLLVNNTESVENSFYDVSKPTKFITHGWISNSSSPSITTVRSAFLTRADFNVIVVDWSKIAGNNYISSATRVKPVGTYVGRMIEFLESLGSSLNLMTLVGHSLGAHIVGLAGNSLNKKVAHIVGLDPAAPGFELNTEGGRLHYRDANNVEVIHTSAGWLGIFNPIGDFDYYPNGIGSGRQPGCGIDIEISCSHGRSFRYYSESITNPEAWFAVLCPTRIDFLSGSCEGHPIAPFPRWYPDFSKPKGVYMLRTRSTEPFGLGLAGTRPDNNIFRLLS